MKPLQGTPYISKERAREAIAMAFRREIEKMEVGQWNKQKSHKPAQVEAIVTFPCDCVFTIYKGTSISVGNRMRFKGTPTGSRKQSVHIDLTHADTEGFFEKPK